MRWPHRRHAQVAHAAAPHRRISFLIRSLDIGGAQRQLIELASSLPRLGWHVSVLVFYANGELEADLRQRGVKVEILGKGGRWDVVRFSYRLARAVRRERPDILHGYLGTPNLFSVAARPLVPGMRVVWGIRASNMDLTAYDWLSRASGAASRRLVSLADLVICNSTAGMQVLEAAGYPSGRMVVVPNGIDSERFKPDPVLRSELRNDWSVAADALLVGNVGRLDPMKDHDTFLRAAALVARVRPEVRFVCVGDGPDQLQSRLQSVATELGLDDRLMWPGARMDMPRVYAALDLLVLSSRWGEGFPNVVAEAMASGVPCVVTDVGDARLVVGDAGWVCPIGDPEAMAQMMLAAIASRDDLAECGQRARSRICQEFDTDRLATTTSSLLARLVDGQA